MKSEPREPDPPERVGTIRARMRTAIQNDPAESDRLRDEGARMQHQEKRRKRGEEGGQQQVEEKREEASGRSEEDLRQAKEFEDLCRKQAEKDVINDTRPESDSRHVREQGGGEVRETGVER